MTEFSCPIPARIDNNLKRQHCRYDNRAKKYNPVIMQPIHKRSINDKKKVMDKKNLIGISAEIRNNNGNASDCRKEFLQVDANH
jgi:hypothetical protein